MKRFLVTVRCWCIVAPVLPFHLLHGFCEWAAVDRKWSRRLINRAERLAARHGVDL